MITRTEILMGRDKEYPLSPVLEGNLRRLLIAVNRLRQAYGKPMRVSSGYRPGHYNSVSGASLTSQHCLCRAVDFADPNGDIDAWVMAHLAEVKAMGLVGIEAPEKTPGWCHVDLKQRYDAKGRPVQVFK